MKDQTCVERLVHKFAFSMRSGAAIAQHSIARGRLSQSQLNAAAGLEEVEDSVTADWYWRSTGGNGDIMAVFVEANATGLV